MCLLKVGLASVRGEFPKFSKRTARIVFQDLLAEPQH